VSLKICCVLLPVTRCQQFGARSRASSMAPTSSRCRQRVVDKSNSMNADNGARVFRFICRRRR